MSKRHQSSRRKSYGRRQHELRERPPVHLPDRVGSEWNQSGDVEGRDTFSFLEPRVPRLRFVLGD